MTDIPEKIYTTKPDRGAGRPFERPMSPLVSNSLMLPKSVWDWLRDEAQRTGKPINLVVMRALKACGAPIAAADLVDGKKIR